MTLAWDEVDLAQFPGRDLVPQLTRLADYVAHWADRTPAALADKAGEVSRTYAQLDQDITACARALQAVGVVAGDRVAMLTDPRPEFLTVLAALGRVGAVWVGLNPAYTFAELEHVLADAKPRVAITLGSHRGVEIAAEFAELAKANAVERTVVLDQESSANLLGWADFLAHGSQTELDWVEVSAVDPALIE